MSKKRKFNFKPEVLLAIAGYLIQRVRADLSAFAEFSETFCEEFLTRLNAKMVQCSQLINSNVLTQDIEAITNKIKALTVTLRLNVNKIEVYLKMADGEMTVDAQSLGLKELRTSIHKAGSEAMVTRTRYLLVGVNTNLAVLQTKGLKPALVAEMKQLADEMEKLGNDQNFMITERNRHTDENNVIYNELWDMVLLITETGKALYRGVDATKLNDYTLSSLLQRVGISGRSTGTDTPETPAV